MQISSLEEYGLRCALQLAKLGELETISASQIADLEGISMQYAAKILHLFRKAGLVFTVRGVQGGFRLSRDRSEITLQHIFSAVHSAKRNSSFCTQYKGQNEECVHLGNCSARPVWQLLSGYFSQVLERITLADLLSTEAQSRERIEIHARRSAENLEAILRKSMPIHGELRMQK